MSEHIPRLLQNRLSTFKKHSVDKLLTSSICIAFVAKHTNNIHLYPSVIEALRCKLDFTITELP